MVQTRHGKSSRGRPFAFSWPTRPGAVERVRSVGDGALASPYHAYGGSEGGRRGSSEGGGYADADGTVFQASYATSPRGIRLGVIARGVSPELPKTL